MKKIAMGPKPQMAPVTADDWVTGKADIESSTQSGESVSDKSAQNQQEIEEAKVTEVVQLKRLTLDIPEELHARIKSQCALRRIKMVDAIRQILDESFVV